MHATRNEKRKMKKKKTNAIITQVGTYFVAHVNWKSHEKKNNMEHIRNALSIVFSVGFFSGRALKVITK
jgi:ribose 5-phosphate isomerase